ncbi:uncharacterized protein FOMMEDRAFT_165738 [Fomitiporia mediterranea MF3/22]|uniref:uncharacterized protein n=1 Tax=Fomitiporia mediterranea (strain MF3/22) TaxID=694068 RepID=UPI0004408DCF|nr:uncharacterized protein FOMMEDRAFT_165738 [Fomitiporia mediterranea MF3/22]EJD07141.1 hypothetical protein FOMMEDRAFT_165738 [Fomitiporia mediterranea MF3/22]
MAPSTIIQKRASDASSSPDVDIGSLQIPIYGLVGIGIAVVALISLVLCLGIRAHRKRARRKREEKRNSAFLTVKGVVKETSLGMKQATFSRANLTASVVMPDKAIFRPDATRDDIVSFYSDQGKLPRPFAPFSFALNVNQAVNQAPSTASSSTEIPDKRVSTLSFSASAARLPNSPGRSRESTQSSTRDSIRESFFGGRHARTGSALSGGSRFSAFSTGSSTARNSGSAAGLQQRTVRQVFTPILPDEFTLTLGERVSVLRSFDDGWCIVARPKLQNANGTDAELGAVPAWCFVKPLKGLRSERPVRSTSLGVTVQVEQEDRPRNDIISWSNF